MIFEASITVQMQCVRRKQAGPRIFGEIRTGIPTIRTKLWSKASILALRFALLFGELRYNITLVNKVQNWPLKCTNMNINGAYGLSASNRRLLEEKEATGSPSIAVSKTLKFLPVKEALENTHPINALTEVEDVLQHH